MKKIILIAILFLLAFPIFSDNSLEDLMRSDIFQKHKDNLIERIEEQKEIERKLKKDNKEIKERSKEFEIRRKKFEENIEIYNYINNVDKYYSDEIHAI